MLTDVLYAVFVIGGLGLLFGAGLGFAGKKFAVEEDERIGRVREALPGANCGGCGYPGCDQLANAIVKGTAGNGDCPVGGAATAQQIAGIMGVAVNKTVISKAFVKCSGDASKALYRYEYEGLNDCRQAAQLSGGGSKACRYGCLGLGACAKICPYDAISLVNNVAVVDPDKCKTCGKCVNVCPRKLIEITPEKSLVRVACSSKDSGKTVREQCSAGCISCQLCVKACQYDAVHVQDMLSRIDYGKCVSCGACVAKCPTKVIKQVSR